MREGADEVPSRCFDHYDDVTPEQCHRSLRRLQGRGTAIVRGRSVEVHGIEDDEARTLGEVHASVENLDLDDMRLAVELTPRGTRAAWA